jgi:hypothetical protein
VTAVAAVATVAAVGPVVATAAIAPVTAVATVAAVASVVVVVRVFVAGRDLLFCKGKVAINLSCAYYLMIASVTLPSRRSITSFQLTITRWGYLPKVLQRSFGFDVAPYTKKSPVYHQIKGKDLACLNQ